MLDNNQEDPNIKVQNILSHMSSMSEEDLAAIIKAIPNTKYAHFENVFVFCQDYLHNMNKMPDKAYLNIQFPGLIQYDFPSFHENYILEFRTLLEAESTTNKVYYLMSQGKHSEASSLISTFSNNKKVSDILSAQDIFQNFRSLRKEASYGLKSGIPELDDIIKFYMYKHLNVIVAPSSNYKTTMACNIVYQAIVSQKMNVVYLNLEDTTENIWFNLFARHSYEINKPISVEEFKRYLLPDARLNVLDEVENNWKSLDMGKLAVISSAEIGSFTPANIHNTLLQLKSLWGHIDVVVVDHFNIMNDPIPGLKISGPELFAYYVRYMTNLAISFDKKGLILIGLAQANREAKVAIDKGKEMSTVHIANTSELERSATTVMSMYVDYSTGTNPSLKMKILKNRLGQTGQVICPALYPAYAKIGQKLQKNIIQVADLAQMQQSMSMTIPKDLVTT